MLKGIFSKDRIILGFLILVLLGLISFIFFRFQLVNNSLVSARELYSGVQKSFHPSQAIISLDKTNLKIIFKISSSDRIGLEAFLKNLEIINPKDQEVNIELGDTTSEFVDKLISKNHLTQDNSKLITLNLRILSKEIDFDNKKIFGPFDSTSENLLESPLDSGNITTQSLGEDSYSIEIDNPGKILSESTLSGKLKLSDQLNDSEVWQKLTKLARINLNIEEGVLNGTIFLK